jgi:hypothetical protein
MYFMEWVTCHSRSVDTRPVLCQRRYDIASAIASDKETHNSTRPQWQNGLSAITCRKRPVTVVALNVPREETKRKTTGIIALEPELHIFFVF